MAEATTTMTEAAEPAIEQCPACGSWVRPAGAAPSPRAQAAEARLDARLAARAAELEHDVGR